MNRRRLALGLASALPLFACEAVFGIDAKEPSAAGLPEASPGVEASTGRVDAASPDSASDASGDSAPAPRRGPLPPPRPETTSGGGSRDLAFAVRRYYFGAIDPVTDTVDYTAWQRMGFDIDQVDTQGDLAASDRPGTCRRSATAPQDALVDGDDGRDNNFGGKFIRTVGDLGPSRESVELGASGTMNHGNTALIVLEGLSDGPDDAEVAVGLMTTVMVEERPWEEVTSITIDGRSVLPGTTEAKLRFRQAYMTGHVVVAGDLYAPPGTVLFPFDPQSRPIGLNPLGYVLVLELDAGHTRVVRSTSVSVLTLTDMVNVLTPAAVRWGFAPCTPAGQELLYGLVRPLADLSSGQERFLDATGSTECDAISAAMGLAWHPVNLPLLEDVVERPPGTDDCGG